MSEKNPNENKIEELNEALIKVQFLKKYEMVNEKNEKTGEIMKKGDELEVPESVVKFLVDGKFAKVVEIKSEDEEEKDEEEECDCTEMVILNAKNKPLRTYSLTVHGKGFKALAKQYMEGHPGTHI